MAELQQLVGRIRKVKREKGYGFIRTREGKDYFAHFRDVTHKKEFQVGNHARFVALEEPTDEKSGTAIHVEVVSCPQT